MVKSKNRWFCKNRKKYILKLGNEKVEQQIIHPKKDLHTIKNKRVKNSTIETKFESFGNKVSMIETSNRVDE